VLAKGDIRLEEVPTVPSPRTICNGGGADGEESKSMTTTAKGLCVAVGLLRVLASSAAWSGTVASLTADAPAPRAAHGSTLCQAIPQIHTHQFPDSPSITNPLLPMAPGMQYVYDGFVVLDRHHHPHQIVSTITDLTKVVDGVRTIVVFEQDFQDGLLQESEVFFEAQDVDGTVWHLGEYPEVYANGQLSGAPDTWLSGVQSATAGIDMPAVPHEGDIIVQGYSPAIQFWDCARFLRLRTRRCIPSGCYHDVVVINEFAPLDPGGGHQLKYNAPQVGNIAARPLGDPEPEILNLTSAGFLCPDALAAIRQATLAQDQRGYGVASGVYVGPPALQTLQAGTCAP
jgi:hypothetical protein